MEFPRAVRRRDGGGFKEFKLGEIEGNIISSVIDLGGDDFELAKDLSMDIGSSLYQQYGPIVTPEQVDETVFDILMDKKYDGTAYMARARSKRKRRAREKASVLGSSRGSDKSSTDNFLMVGSASKETSAKWDRSRIVGSLINETGIDLITAESVAEEVETNIFSSETPHVTTSLIREMAHMALLRRNDLDAAKRYKNYTIPRNDLERLLLEKNKENSNIISNNPEAIAFSIGGNILKQFAFDGVYSEDISVAHSTGAIHTHDLDSAAVRNYCSAHSLEYIKKFGLDLPTASSKSGPAKHTDVLIGHLNTFMATMQSFYAGALGIGDINTLFAPLLRKGIGRDAYRRINGYKDKYHKDLERIEQFKQEGKDVSLLEKILDEDRIYLDELEKNPISVLDEEEIDRYFMQRAQKMIYNGSQNAFSRGCQTLFLDFNIHAGVPGHLKDTPIILDGKYQLQDSNGKLVALEERKLSEKTRRGYKLMELVDPRNNEIVLRESLEQVGKQEHLIQSMTTKEGEKVLTYKDYDWEARQFTKALLKVFGKGDSRGKVFEFPKCDFHINEETLKKPKLLENFILACESSSKNGSTYFVFDRDEVTMSACCRLRTTIEDDYVLKHPETMRFCGFQNVTLNLPQAAYRAARKGKKNLEGFLEEIDFVMDLAVKAHLQKKSNMEKMQQPGGPQHAVGKNSLDGLPYVDLDLATFIIGYIGLNDASKFLVGKEMHDMNPEEIKENIIKPMVHMYLKTKKYSEEYGLKFSIEESPAESAAKRLASVDLEFYPESKEFIKGDIESGGVYYTNSSHLSADAPVDLVTRIEMQGMLHPVTESGAITHAFVGEEEPPAETISNLVKKTFRNTQTAQLTISPEFTICRDCGSTQRGLKDNCFSCDSDNVYGEARIVGYYSEIPAWLISKLKELDARHKGNYSLLDMAPTDIVMPKLEGGSSENEYVSHRFGREDCPACEDLGKAVDRVAEHYGKKDIKMKHVYHDIDTSEGMTEFLIAGLNLSRVPGIVIVNGGKEVYKNETNWGKEKDKFITSIKLKKGMEAYLSAK